MSVRDKIMWAKRSLGHGKFISRTLEQEYRNHRFLQIRTVYNSNSNAKPSKSFPVLSINTKTQPTTDQSDISKNVLTERQEAFQRSLIAAEAHCKLENVCREGGGERGAKRHVEVNRKELVRERIS